MKIKCIYTDTFRIELIELLKQYHWSEIKYKDMRFIDINVFCNYLEANLEPLDVVDFEIIIDKGLVWNIIS